MSKDKEILDSIADKEYEHGFVTNVEQEFIPKGLNEDIIRLISAKKEEPEWMLEFRLKAFRRWQQMELPRWAHLDIPEIDFQDIIYYAAPKKAEDRPKEIDPELEKTFDKLGIPLHERAALAGVAVDAVFDSVSVTTTLPSLSVIKVVSSPLFSSSSTPPSVQPIATMPQRARSRNSRFIILCFICLLSCLLQVLRIEVEPLF